MVTPAGAAIVLDVLLYAMDAEDVERTVAGTATGALADTVGSTW